MSIYNSKKNLKNGKRAHGVFLCDILTTEFDKQVLHTFKRKNYASNVVSSNIEL